MISIAISIRSLVRGASTQISYLWDLIPVWLPKKKDMFSEYNKVSIEFQPVETIGNFNRLVLDRCQVVECGVRLLHA